MDFAYILRNFNKYVVDSISLYWRYKFIFSTNICHFFFFLNIGHFLFFKKHLLQKPLCKCRFKKNSSYLLSADLAQTLPLLFWFPVPFWCRRMLHWDESFNCHLVTRLTFSPQLLTWRRNFWNTPSNAFIWNRREK